MDLSKHVVFIVWEPHWATWEESDIDSLCACFAGAYFFEFLMIFSDFGIKMVSKSIPKLRPNGSSSRKSTQKWPQWGPGGVQGAELALKWRSGVPKDGTKWRIPGLQNGFWCA